MIRHSLVSLVLAGGLLASIACSSGSVTVGKNPGEQKKDDVACTTDAKQCPDGSYVGRSGPNCEFAACPGEDAGGACTQDALECPDGTFVSRTGPNCSFAACPVTGADGGYVCPRPGNIDCMPIVDSAYVKLCESSFRQWAQANCPGVTYTD
jgi:hypothetical protein